ncbi:hypothetical protein Ddc_12229 [Ditylenchus destructor]|nr:hypothetical protein Ddc_12229 [Ditylenchus destructor]
MRLRPKPTICDITTTHDSTERRDEKKNPLFSITATMDTSIKRAKQTMGRRHPDKNSDESISKMSSLRHPVACKSKSDLSTESRSMRPSLRPPSSVHRVKSGLSIDAAEKSRQQHSKSKVSIDGLKTCRDPPTEHKSKEQTKVHKTHIDRESKRIQVGESDSSRKKYKAKVRNTVDKSTRTLDESSANRKNRAKKKHPKKDRLIPEMRASEVGLNGDVGLNDDLGPTNQPSAKVTAARKLLSRSALETLGDVFPNLLQNA